MPTVSTRPVPRQRKFDHAGALELAVHGWRNSEIAQRYKVSESAVKQALSKYAHLLNDLQPGSLEAYRSKRNDLFTLVEREMMASLLDPAAISKASLNNRAYAFQQIHTARRLEEEKSTANSSAVLHVLIEQSHAKLFSKANKPQPPIAQDAVPPETPDESSPEPV